MSQSRKNTPGYELKPNATGTGRSWQKVGSKAHDNAMSAQSLSVSHDFSSPQTLSINPDELDYYDEPLNNASWDEYTKDNPCEIGDGMNISEPPPLSVWKEGDTYHVEQEYSDDVEERLEDILQEEPSQKNIELYTQARNEYFRQHMGEELSIDNDTMTMNRTITGDDKTLDDLVGHNCDELVEYSMNTYDIPEEIENRYFELKQEALFTQL